MQSVAGAPALWADAEEPELAQPGAEVALRGAYEAAIKKMEPASSQRGNIHRLKQEQQRQNARKNFSL